MRHCVRSATLHCAVRALSTHRGLSHFIRPCSPVHRPCCLFLIQVIHTTVISQVLSYTVLVVSSRLVRLADLVDGHLQTWPLWSAACRAGRPARLPSRHVPRSRRTAARPRHPAPSSPLAGARARNAIEPSWQPQLLARAAAFRARLQPLRREYPESLPRNAEPPSLFTARRDVRPRACELSPPPVPHAG